MLMFLKSKGRSLRLKKEKRITGEDGFAELAQSMAAFRSFGFVGTPGIAVGRTLVNGVIAPRVLRRLVEIEIDGDGPC